MKNKGLLILVAVIMVLFAWYFAGDSFYTQRLSAMLVSQSPTDATKLHEEGLQLFYQGKFKDAIDIWLQELKLYPQNANTYNNIGMAYKEMGDLANSLKYHLKAVELDTSFGHGYYSLGIAYFESNAYDKALDAFLRSIELSYKPADSYYYIGHIHQEKHNCERAIEAFEKAKGLNPSFGPSIQHSIEICRNELRTSSQFQMIEVMECCEEHSECEANDFNLCIPGTLASGRAVTLISGKDQVCHAKTGEQSGIRNSIFDSPGTALENIDCKNTDNQQLAVLNEVVTDYEKLELSEVKDKALVSALEREIETAGLLNNYQFEEDGVRYLPKSNVVYQYPFPGRKVFFVLYSPLPLILINNDSHDLLTDTKDCAEPKSAFRMNGRYYAQVLHCACESDSCGFEFREIEND